MSASSIETYMCGIQRDHFYNMHAYIVVMSRNYKDLSKQLPQSLRICLAIVPSVYRMNLVAEETTIHIYVDFTDYKFKNCERNVFWLLKLSAACASSHSRHISHVHFCWFTYYFLIAGATMRNIGAYPNGHKSRKKSCHKPCSTLN